MNGDERLFVGCALASVGLHAALVTALFLLKPFSSPSAVEIDLTHFSFLGTGAAKLGETKKIALSPTPGPALPAVPLSRPKPSPVPAPNGKEKPSPAAPPPSPQTSGGAKNGSGTSPLAGGAGKGADFGTPNGSGNGGADLVSLPRLLNLDEIIADLRRFYPESERRAGHQGQVVVNLHIGVNGLVTRVDIVRSASPAFDRAAGKVAKLMRFAPAIAKSGPVAVVIQQPVVFHLENN